MDVKEVIELIEKKINKLKKVLSGTMSVGEYFKSKQYLILLEELNKEIKELAGVKNE